MTRISTRIAVGGVALTLAAVAGLIGVNSAGAAPRTHSATTHTLKFIAVTTSESVPNKLGQYYEADVDVRPYSSTAAAATVAQDVASCAFGSSSVSCTTALANTGGLLYGSFSISESTGQLAGTVTGGTGAYAGATGTISGSPSGPGYAVTVTYS